jgi:phospholipase D-like protein/putative oligomerization/nucleic acid binding protein
MSFWDIVWFIFITYAFVAYLVVLFHIIGDVFRDREAGAFAKAAWVILLCLFPLITAICYLLVRGRGMAERSAQRAVVQQNAQDAYIREVSGQTTPSDQIAQARALFDAGAISQSEYDALKTKALV